MCITECNLGNFNELQRGIYSIVRMQNKQALKKKNSVVFINCFP